jgi:hypothetical protein
MTRSPVPDGLLMSLSLPSLAGLLLLLLTSLEPGIRYASNFHVTLTALIYLGFFTSLVALFLGLTQRTRPSVTSYLCFALNLAWFIYAAVLLFAVWMFTHHG